ncbi:hypothetical protein D9M72_340870 [compost metagenome]
MPSPVSGSGLPPLAEPSSERCLLDSLFTDSFRRQSSDSRWSSVANRLRVSSLRRLQVVAGLNERAKSVRVPSVLKTGKPVHVEPRGSVSCRSAPSVRRVSGDRSASITPYSTLFFWR